MLASTNTAFAARTFGRQSLMPAYDEKALPENDLQDLLAFLAAASGGGK